MLKVCFLYTAKINLICSNKWTRTQQKYIYILLIKFSFLNYKVLEKDLFHIIIVKSKILLIKKLLM